ncbi:MAG TPA: LuxR C-terminal-related transcriptional regulator [Mycobacteriales bacterium]|nr:LuxR C-terminal-related transcriptional regulator [Mycobacteriales bacterium]
MPADRREVQENGILETFGLTSQAEMVWRALMRHPDINLEELTQRTGLPLGEVQDALGGLTSAQLVRTAQSPSGVLAMDPQLAIASHIARAEHELALRTAKLAELRAHTEALSEDYQAGRTSTASLPGAEIVTDLDDLRRRIYLASEGAVEMQRSLIRSPSAEGLQDGSARDSDQANRGVEQRTIIRTCDLTDRDIYAHLEAQHRRGERVRALGNVPTQMLIMDSALAVLAVDPQHPRRGALFVREPGIVSLMIYLFDHLWSEADPVFGEATAAGAPTGRVARVLELIAAGVKDERIARTLGVATRTVRRDIAELKDNLGVSSRTEVVAAAVRQGWL